MHLLLFLVSSMRRVLPFKGNEQAWNHKVNMKKQVLMVALCCLLGVRLAADDELALNFVRPPDKARPWVYWFWLNSNISSNGITADLEAMKRAGIGGVLIMEVDQGAPVGPVAFMSPQWREMFKHVVVEAQRLGLEVNMNNDAGWNGSGGPWIQPEQAMQKVVWSETNLTGPMRFEGALAQPKAVRGFYRDIAVQAFPTPDSRRVENIQVKASFEVGGVGVGVKPNQSAEKGIDRDRITDLSPKMDKNGRLVWDVPPGQWTVMRFGHTCTGVENAPAPASGRGLECDKLSKEGIEANFAGMMGKLIADAGSAVGKTLAATHIDSWENGSQNWTAKMREEFQRRRGYDMMPFLAAMTGRIVGDLEITERFLWDLRKTVSDLVVEYYAEHMRALARQHGLRLSIEAYGGPCDNAPYAGRADEPMSEFWIGGGAFETCKEMASAAHTYGKRILGAEAFTAADQEKWLEHPARIKALGDRAFCEGVNRFVFHRYAMQPWSDYKPGMTMGPWGLHYERTQTWWEQSKPWHEYLARCQFLLRRGLFVADICHLMPEAAPQGYTAHERRGYDFDNCGAEVVLKRMTVKDGRLMLPDGMSYRLLVLPEGGAMTPKLARKIQELVQAGATVVGPRPVQSPSLADYPNCDRDVKRIADELWGDCDGKSIQERSYGQGRIVCGIAPEKVLAEAGVKPDFSSRARLRYIHRVEGDTDIYFVANAQPQAVQAVCTFRVSGKQPDLWWPDSGRMEKAAAFNDKNGVTSVLLPLEPSGSVFVVFRKNAQPIDPVVAMTRDGKSILSVENRAPKVVVQKAVYGLLNDPQRTCDARAAVQKIVDGGEVSFMVSRLAQSSDPAPEKIKTLVVEYVIGEERFTVTGKDSDTVRLTDNAIGIVVERAVYGVPGDAVRTRDMKAKVQQIVDAGENSFEVARLAAGDDPAFGIVKTAVIEYTVGGKKMTVTGIDPETITLTQTKASERIADVRLGADGQPILEAWQAGQYELLTASGRTRHFQAAALPAPVELNGPWQVAFPPSLGAPSQITLDKLMSWSDHSDNGVKHFSGAATYNTRFVVPDGMAGKNRHVHLDLGKVQIMAQVILNGKDLGLFWKPPFLIDVTDAVKAGENKLEVTVVNLWINRMIGDELLPEDSDRNPDGTLKSWPTWVNEGKPSPSGRFTFTSWRLWKKNAPLQESGLIGPVTLMASEDAAAK
jgi:hypothetical protein